MRRVEIPAKIPSCAECTHHGERTATKLSGVELVRVQPAAEKVVLRPDPECVSMETTRQTVAAVGGGSVVEGSSGPRRLHYVPSRSFTLWAAVFGFVLLVVIAGEWLGLLRAVNKLLPLPVGIGLVIGGGWSVFRQVIRSALRRRITSHTLMTLGAIAALVVGEWITAALLVVFMHVGEFVERMTIVEARRAIQELTSLAPQTARVERGGTEIEVPVGEVQVGETVVVRPGERIPVDGEVIGGRATVEQAAITGESMPAEVGPGSRVFAASIARLGSLRIRALRIGADTALGRAVQMVEEAETHRAEVQRFADQFSTYYLPVVIGIAALTWFIGRNPLAAAAVLVVVCSCSIALATPVAMLATIGAAARRGLLIKGGRHIETLARADVVLVDKTGTLTLGRPVVTDVVPLSGTSDSEVLALAATAERYSEHPVAEAVREAARARGIRLGEPEEFTALPGLGVRARVDGKLVVVGNRRLVAALIPLPEADRLEAQGKTVLFLSCDGRVTGLVAVADKLRPEVPEAIAELRRLGIQHIELLTGDEERVTAPLAQELGIAYRAGLLPEDKIRAVREYQVRGHTVLMIGDGVNDAPALAQADVGIAMGAAGTDIALEAAPIALMRENWWLVPEILRIARRTMHVVRQNLVLTAIYNVTGVILAAVGILPPVLAAAAQSLPDVGILANSMRLLRTRTAGELYALTSR
ncbi:MAG: cation-translocating P-type ATPase [candidate division KSB1 bacterium]|nr:cation-translocating P-type ATPase [candidate division KSB1 bacterium]